MLFAYETNNAFLSFLINDFWISIPMILMSFTGIALVVWRILLNMNYSTNLNEWLPLFQQKLQKEGTDGALRLCRTRTDYIPRQLFASGLETSKQGTSAMRRSMANVIELEILPDLNFLLPPILAIAKIATMVGLFGTVVSMIGTFQSIQKSGDATEQSAAIGLALFATAMGLITAIPLVFAHVMMKAWVAKFEVKMKSAAQKFLVMVQAKRGGQAAARPGQDAQAPKSAQGGAVRPGS